MAFKGQEVAYKQSGHIVYTMPWEPRQLKSCSSHAMANNSSVYQMAHLDMSLSLLMNVNSKFSSRLFLFFCITSLNTIHSRSKCLVWVKKCCHIWLDQNFDPSLLTNKLWLVFMRKKQKKNFFFEKKNSKWPTQKNWVFQLPPKAEQLSPKFHRSVLGLVGLIDAKGINVTQPIWPSGCPT